MSVPGKHLSPAIVAALCVVALLPLLPDHILFHPDERHYVDAGLQMAHSGDWLTPRTPEGDVRLSKPILAYWCVAAGAALLGPSPFSTRILFLLSAAGLIWWTARAAREASGEPSAGSLTALLLAIHPALLICATRTLPDILLGLAVAVSLSGFVAILQRGRADWGPLLAAVIGGAAAILAKGAPGLLLTVYGGLYLFVRRRSLVCGHPRRFLAAAVVGLVLAGSWFAVMWLRHSDQLLTQFLTDQGSAYRFVSQGSQVLVQAAVCIGVLAASFVVALLPAVRTLWIRRRELPEFLATPAPRFLAGWIAVYLASAACLNHVTLRYLMPVVPAAAILYSSLLLRFDGPLWRENLRWMAWGAFTLPAGAAGICVLMWWQSAPVATLLVLAATALVIDWLRRQMRFTSAEQATLVLSLACLAAMFILGGSVASQLSPSFGRRMTAALEAAGVGSGRLPELVLIGEPAHSARIRVCSGGRLTVHTVLPADAGDVGVSGPVAALPHQLPQPLAPTTRIVPIPCGLEGVTFSDLCRALGRGELTRYLQQHRRIYLLAVPASQPAEQRFAADEDLAVRRQ